MKKKPSHKNNLHYARARPHATDGMNVTAQVDSWYAMNDETDDTWQPPFRTYELSTARGLVVLQRSGTDGAAFVC